MAKPRVFVSSTYYDLRHIRNSLERFIESLGYEPVLFESGDIPFHHDQPLDESCYDAINDCHIFVIIIGGRYGSPTSDENPKDEESLEKAYKHYNSITKKEYEKARERDILIYIFVEKNVYAEYQTYKKNRKNKTIEYSQVDNVNIYKLLDDILAECRNSLVKDFDKFEDIESWLRDQWAGLFADFLAKKHTETSLKALAGQISSLAQVTSTLKNYSELIIKKVRPEESASIISAEDERLRLESFAREPLIEFVQVCSGKSVEEIYKRFKESHSAEDFFKGSGNDIIVIDSIFFTEDELVEYYDSVKKKYFSAGQELPPKKPVRKRKPGKSV